MPSSASATATLADTSVAVPLLLADHEHHAAVDEALHGRRIGLAGHAAFETFSVLTRMPAPMRRTPAVVATLIAAHFTGTHHLSDGASWQVFERLSYLGIAGGAVFDALVAGAAVEANATLLTRDARALHVYSLMGVDIELIG